MLMRILRKKQQKEVCQRIVANAIIAYDLLDADNTPTDKLIRYTDCIIDNCAKAVYAVGGLGAMLQAKETMCRHLERNLSRKDEQ